MQQFTRTLTREIEVGGERLVLTLSKEGLSVRPVGGRRPPYTMSWAACVCACTSNAGQEPTPEQIEQALHRVRAGAAKACEAASAPQPQKTSSPSTSPKEHTQDQGADPSAVDKMMLLLARLDQWLNTQRQRFLQALRPGATAAECDALAAELGRPLPEELQALLMWHNGQTPDVPGALEQSWMLLSTDEIAEAKKELDEHPHEGWQKDWLPFLGDDNGNYRCLHLGSPGCPVLE